jgi:hypothetical protein
MGKSNIEEITRAWFEHRFGVPFNSVRPDWLLNIETGRNLELDGYNEELALAFEVQGRQHYEYVPHFHKNGVSDLQKQLKHDKQKLLACEKRGIRLVVVPPLSDEDAIHAFLDRQFRTPERDVLIVEFQKLNIRTSTSTTSSTKTTNRNSRSKSTNSKSSKACPTSQKSKQIVARDKSIQKHSMCLVS